MKDAVDTNIILIDPYVLLNNEINNINVEFQKMLKNLKDKLIKDPNKKETQPVEGET